MDQNKVDMYVMTNQKYFPAEKIMYLKEKLAAMDESKFTMVSTVELKDPTTFCRSLRQGIRLLWGLNPRLLKLPQLKNASAPAAVKTVFAFRGGLWRTLCPQ